MDQRWSEYEVHYLTPRYKVKKGQKEMNQNQPITTFACDHLTNFVYQTSVKKIDRKRKTRYT